MDKREVLVRREGTRVVDVDRLEDWVFAHRGGEHLVVHDRETGEVLCEYGEAVEPEWDRPTMGGNESAGREADP